MKEKSECSAREMLAHRQNNFRDGEMADGAIAVVILINGLQEGVRECVMRHRNAVQRADNILHHCPTMVVEGLDAGHAAKGEQQHPRGYLSQTCAHCGGKSTFFSVVSLWKNDGCIRQLIIQDTPQPMA